jgi:hypothetical protein
MTGWQNDGGYNADLLQTALLVIRPIPTFLIEKIMTFPL